MQILYNIYMVKRSVYQFVTDRDRCSISSSLPSFFNYLCRYSKCINEKKDFIT